MKNTRVNVEKFSKDKGLVPIQVDGIPEGFSFLESDLTIRLKTYVGKLTAFIPNQNIQVFANDRKELQEIYKTYAK